MLSKALYSSNHGISLRYDSGQDVGIIDCLKATVPQELRLNNNGIVQTNELRAQSLNGIASTTIAYLDPTSSVQTQLNNTVSATSTNSTLIGGMQAANAVRDTQLSNQAGRLTTLETDIVTKTDEAYVDGQIASLVNGSVASLDTLQELAQAIGNDDNFSTTMTNLIGTKAPQSSLDVTNTNVSTNATNIATNVAGIATNVTNIATNVTNISSKAPQSSLDTTNTNVSTNTTNIATNVTDIATNVTNIT